MQLKDNAKHVIRLSSITSISREKNVKNICGGSGFPGFYGSPSLPPFHVLHLTISGVQSKFIYNNEKDIDEDWNILSEQLD